MVAITWLGHGSFQLRLASGEVILIDPWFEGNPKHPAGFELERCDLILVTHGHFDHINDVVGTAARFNAPVIANHEIATWLASKKGVKDARGMNKGGTRQAGGVAVTMTHAIHSSSMQDDGGNIIYGGEAGGFVLTFEDGRVAYFAGDTNVFSDMALIETLYHPELAFLPIGDLYTMGPREAALACRLLKAKHVIGMHWGTFPALTGTPRKLAELIHDLPGTEILPMEPGRTLQW